MTGPALEIVVLGDDATPAVHAALDAIAQAARRDLVGPRGELEPMAARLGDPARLVLWARLDGDPVGFAEGALHHPEPHALTVAQLAVHGAHRFRGLGRRLVEALAEEARVAAGPLDDVFAAARPDAAAAQAFWSSLGFVAAPAYPELLHPLARPAWLGPPAP